MKRNAWKWCWYVGVVIAAALVTDTMSVNCLAQLDVKSSYELGEPIVVKMVVPEKPDGAVLRKDKFKIVGATAVKVDDTTWHVWAVPGKYTIEAMGEWRLYQTIISKDDKEYKVIADEDDYEFAASFEVTGGDGPVPPPPPPPPPPPGGPYQVVLFYSPDQLDNLTADQRAILNSMEYREKLTKAGHTLLGVLANNAAPSPQSKFRAFYNAVSGDPMPRLAVASEAGGKVVDMPLPATFAELEALLATEVLQ